MREILFKAKIKEWREQPEANRWVEGSLYCDEFGHVFILPSYTNIGESYGGHWWIDDGMDRVDPKTVCQYTGLTDKNGVKIFENDIVRNCEEVSEMYVVKYYAHKGYPAFDCEPEMYYDCNGLSYLVEVMTSEVVGNIFDNPEMVERGVK